jgi:hypothetical protein
MLSLGLAGISWILWLGRGMTFFADEWALISTRSLSDPSTWFQPHNEHWITLPILAYRAIVESVGIGSYVPYLAAVALLHLAVVAAIYRLVRQSTANAPVSVAAALVILLFGSGFENLYWGFQIGFVGATAMCLWAIIALRHGQPSKLRLAIAVALLVAGVATAGVTLAFIAAIATELLFDKRRRIFIPWIAIPIAVSVIWYIVAGRAGTSYVQHPYGLASPFEVPEFIVLGFGSAFGGLAGVGPTLGLAVAAAVLAVTVCVAARGRSVAKEFLGAVVGISVLYALIGVVRVGLSAVTIEYTRYTYVSGVMLIVGLAALVGTVTVPRRRKRRIVWTAFAGGLLATSLVFNVRLLRAGRELFLDRADMTRALVTVALDPGRPSSVDIERSLVLVPSPASLEHIVDAYGSPLGDKLAPDAVRPIPVDVIAEARRRLIEGAPIPTAGG